MRNWKYIVQFFLKNILTVALGFTFYILNLSQLTLNCFLYSVRTIQYALAGVAQWIKC